MKAKDIMTKGVISIKRDATVKDAMKMMLERRVTSLIVEKEKEYENFGILTRKDIINKVIALSRDPSNVKVRDIMSEPLLCISPEFSVENIARLMEKTNIRRFPVVEDDKIIGLVSNSDIMRAVTIEIIK